MLDVMWDAWHEDKDQGDVITWRRGSCLDGKAENHKEKSGTELGVSTANRDKNRNGDMDMLRGNRS